MTVRIADVDQHHEVPVDCCTRHVERRFAVKPSTWPPAQTAGRSGASVTVRSTVSGIPDHGHEAPLDELVAHVGADHVPFGSDGPHGEGRDTPRHFDDELSAVAPADLERILRTNTASLLELR